MIADVARASLGAPHGFFGARGGVSAGAVSGLNVGLGAGDDPAAVRENRARVAAAVLPGATLLTPYQVHGAGVAVVDAPFDAFADDRPRADAIVTATPGLLIGVVTADCAPVLLVDAAAGVVGAAHAGWRGALAGVTDATLAAMEALGAERARVSAAIGPCIAQASYEVDDGFVGTFCQDDPASERFFAWGGSGRPRFDLEGYVAARLARAGVRRVLALGIDTYPAANGFFSFRRATHRGEAGYGRQASAIAVPPR